MRNTVAPVFAWPGWRLFAWADPDLALPMWRFVGLTFNKKLFNGGDYTENSKAAQTYAEHNARVRKICPPDRLLEFKLGSGWEPLCEFLGADVPDVPYPNVNDKKMFIGFHKVVLARAAFWAAQKILGGAASVGVVAGAFWYWNRLRS